MSTLEKIYEAQLAAQKEQLKQDYDLSDAELTRQKEQNQKITDANLTRTAVEAQKAAVNNAELHNAYGLSSGARAQARLAQENQLQANMTALRVAQQEADAETERQRGLLSKEYASAIRQAQAENDLAKAEALYQEAQQREAAMLSAQQGNSAGGLTFNQAMDLWKETGNPSYIRDYVTYDQYIALPGAIDESDRVKEIIANLDRWIPTWKAQGWNNEGISNVVLSHINGVVKRQGDFTDAEMTALYQYLRRKGYYHE